MEYDCSAVGFELLDSCDEGVFGDTGLACGVFFVEFGYVAELYVGAGACLAYAVGFGEVYSEGYCCGFGGGFFGGFDEGGVCAGGEGEEGCAGACEYFAEGLHDCFGVMIRLKLQNKVE